MSAKRVFIVAIEMTHADAVDRDYFEEWIAETVKAEVKKRTELTADVIVNEVAD